MGNITDSALVTAIRGSATERDWALKHLYTQPILRSFVLKYVQERGGSLDDAKEVFQETLITFDKAIRAGAFQGKCTLNTFFTSIAKWQWVSNRRKSKGHLEFNIHEHDGTVEIIEQQILENERCQMVQEILSKIGPRCKEILHLHKLEDCTMVEIAKKLGLSSPELAKKNAYECRKKFKQYVESHPEYENYFNEYIKY
jgi:RNA polymerase sigma factor (sigma-70 family)